MPGMSKNLFGGQKSLNNLDDDFMASLFKGELNVEQAIALRIIKMSVRDYLFFGLGRNGVTPEKFLEAYYYLYRVRGTDQWSWGDLRTSQRYRGSVDGKFISRTRSLSPKEVSWRCFDTHYNLCALPEAMPMNKFLDKIKEKREGILKANEKQVLTYMDKYRIQEWRRLTRRKGKHAFPRVSPIPLLIAPDDVKAFAQLYLFGRDAKPVAAGATASRHPHYKSSLFTELEGNGF